MCEAAFSSKSVLRKTRSVSPTREEASTRASSPRRRAPPSVSSSARRVASPLAARASAIAPALGRAGLDDPPARQAQLEPLDHPAAQRERERAADGAVGAPAVRAREDLLRRHVRDVPVGGLGLGAPRHPPRARDQAALELGAGTAIADRVEAALGHRAGPRLELVQPLAP